jgi:sulfite reductase (NADPH) hemoprotein beta-component
VYQYDSIDANIVAQRVEEFRDQVHRRVSGELTEDEFKPLRLMNGLYLQLHTYMLRVAIPYGTLSSKQLRRLARIARVYDRGYGHFTTRQNIQYNWPKLEQTPDILAELAEVEMHAIQTSGNCIRNVTADPFAGAVADEVEDPRIASEVIRQWSTFHPEFSYLPRKFKIAVTGCDDDRAAIAVHDIGIQVVRRDGEVGYRVLVGGGQGRTPHLAHEMRPFVPRERLLSYLEAIMRVYNRHGRRDNIYKARIKILVNALGADTFRDEVEAEWEAMRNEQSRADGPEARADVPEAEWERIASFFRLDLEPAQNDVALRVVDPLPAAYRAWHDNNVLAHKVPGWAIVQISLKPPGGIPGDASADQMDRIADLADALGTGEIRVTHQQNLVLPHVRRKDLHSLWQGLEAIGLGAPNVGTVTDIIACPGLDYCSLANARSIPVAQELSERFVARQHELGEMSIKISGCINACGHHHVGNIGILGIDKRGEEAYQIAIGGHERTDASLGKILGPAVSREEVGDAVERILDAYVALRNEGEPFIDTYRRVGHQAFKEFVHADLQS